MRCSEKAGKSAQQTRRGEPRITRQTQSRPGHVSAKIISYRYNYLRDNLYELLAVLLLLPHVAGMMILAESESRCFHLLLSAPFCPPILKPHLKHKKAGARFIYRRRGSKRFNSTPWKLEKRRSKRTVPGWRGSVVTFTRSTHATFNLENHAFRIV